jgi:hypothetical protein
MTKLDILRSVYASMGTPTAQEQTFLGVTEIWALSQYGYRLSGPHTSLAEAEQAALDYYTSTPHRWLCLTQDTQYAA